jgi:hypothetical protein
MSLIFQIIEETEKEWSPYNYINLFIQDGIMVQGERSSENSSLLSKKKVKEFEKKK